MSKFALTTLVFVICINSASAGPIMERISKGLNIAGSLVDMGKSIVASIKEEEAVSKHISFDGNTIKTTSKKLTNDKKEIAKEYWKLGYEFQKQKKHINAVSKFRKSLMFNANNPQAWHAYAWSLSELDLHDRAITAFTMSLTLGNKRSDETWRYLGWTYHKDNLLEKARECYLEALFNNPNNKKARYALKSLSDSKEAI